MVISGFTSFLDSERALHLSVAMKQQKRLYLAFCLLVFTNNTEVLFSWRLNNQQRCFELSSARQTSIQERLNALFSLRFVECGATHIKFAVTRHDGDVESVTARASFMACHRKPVVRSFMPAMCSDDEEAID